MKKLFKNYLKKFEDNELSLDEITDLRYAKENSVEIKIFWELQEIARQEKDAADFFQQMKYQKNLLKEES